MGLGKKSITENISKLNSCNTPDLYSEENYIIVKEIVEKYKKTHAINGYIDSIIFKTFLFLRKRIRKFFS